MFAKARLSGLEHECSAGFASNGSFRGGQIGSPVLIRSALSLPWALAGPRCFGAILDAIVCKVSVI